MGRMKLLNSSLLLSLVFVMSLVTACIPSSRGDRDDDDSALGGDGFAGALAVTTSLGSFEIQLFPEDAPITCANFMAYVDEGFYDGEDGLGATVFHRVISGFMIQGGGQTASGAAKSTHAAIINEAATSGLSNLRGTLAMARTNQPNSATSQFFINLVDNEFLDPGPDSDGYAVFGEVTSGMDVVEAIGVVSTGAQDVPLEPVVIEQVERIE